MFSQGFKKTATTVVTMSPEHYYDIVREKDPYQGAVAGAMIGAAAAAKKAPSGSKAKAALAGAAAGAASGAAIGHFGGKAIRGYQAKRVRRLAGELSLRATPARSTYEE